MNVNNIIPQYFKFEEDFVEDGVRCIPMIVRIKLDLIGIKLKLTEWSKFSPSERKKLAELNISSEQQRKDYVEYLCALIQKRTGKPATQIEILDQFDWNTLTTIPSILVNKMKEFDWELSVFQWGQLSALQRFALLKLCRPGHENRNFPIAFTEFGLTTS